MVFIFCSVYSQHFFMCHILRVLYPFCCLYGSSQDNQCLPRKETNLGAQSVFQTWMYICTGQYCEADCVSTYRFLLNSTYNCDHSSCSFIVQSAFLFLSASLCIFQNQISVAKCVTILAILCNLCVIYFLSIPQHYQQPF